MEFIQLKLPTHTIFYSGAIKSATREVLGRPIIGDWYDYFKYGDVGTVIAPIESLKEPGEYFLNLLITDNKDFQDVLWDNYNNLLTLSLKLQDLYYQNIKTGYIPDLDEFYYEYIEIFSLSIGLDTSLDFVLDNYFKNHDINIDTLPVWGQSFLAEEKLGLAKIAQLSDDKKREELFDEHYCRYAWIMNNYTGAHDPSKEYFRNRLGGLAHEDLELEILREVNRPSSLKEWFAFLIYKRDVRKKCNIIANGLIDKYVRDYCQRNNLDYVGISMLTMEEFLQHKFNNLSKERRFHMTKDGPIELSEDEWERVISTANNSQKESDSIVGAVASKGVVDGRVVVVLKPQEFGKVQPGDVLVASMTRPEYAPVLNKVAAIITNEGGITCHAAIISRELKIPCIIGTKIATSVLKDGDIVEVDADKGVVKIIKRAS